MKRNDRTVGVKAWAWALALGFFSLSALSAFAGFTLTGKISSKARKQLYDQTVYTVTEENLTVKGSPGWSGLYMAENATAVLYIPAGITLKVQGGAGSDTTGAGAGIEIPASSTLIVTGGGRLEATGGNAANGGNGQNGGDAQVIKDDDDPHDEYGKAGTGGTGGAGGGGAGAGIGGNGGTGGAIRSTACGNPLRRTERSADGVVEAAVFRRLGRIFLPQRH